ncbi:MAG TPA: YwiC-like family protein [Anaerolineaceae bacterium]|nr:YwiC-like family protein [Anaerolineaceae bacterium]
MANRAISRKNIDLMSALKAKHIAIPSEHGAWVFLLSPLLMGLFLGGISKGSLPLVLTTLAAFLIRQPLTILVKIHAGRRSTKERLPALIWFTIYAVILLINLLILVYQGFMFIFYLAVPAVPVFMWHLWLVSKRAERRQKLIEIAAGGVLALAAPAAYWVGLQAYHSTGWLLWVLSWGQVTGTILYAYLRLNQRQITEKPMISQLLRLSQETLLFNILLFLMVVILSVMGLTPALLPLAFLIQPFEVMWGTFNPAIKLAPKWIGIRQLWISTLFTVVFIFLWL